MPDQSPLRDKTKNLAAWFLGPKAENAEVEEKLINFILQDYFQKDWAENFMMQLMVDDLDAWWTHIDALDLPGRFNVQPPRAPAMQPWGLRIVYLWDPSGVLWHIGERRDGAIQD